MYKFIPIGFLIVVCIIVATAVTSTTARAQAETVPADHPVYDFLRRMEVRKVLSRYHATVVPLSRRQVASYINEVYENRETLSRTDRNLAHLYHSEFYYDLAGEFRDTHSLLSTETSGQSLGGLLSDDVKYLYAWHDTSGNSFFVNGILSYEHRSRTREGAGIDGRSSPALDLFDFGGRVRGTLYGRIGYFVQGANMMVNGDRVFAREDNRIVHSHSFRRSREDFAEQSMAHVRYDAGIVGVQLGRERLEWRESQGASLFLAENAPMFNFLRVDVSLGAVNYNYVHGTVLHQNYLELDENLYYVANRFEFSVFDNTIQLGLNQTTMYKAMSPELGFLIPFSILEATERNLGDRGSSLLGFDVAIRPVGNIEIKTGMFFDDIHVDKSFFDHIYNMWSVHAGVYYVNVLGLNNVDATVNYTRIEPYVYSHQKAERIHYQHDGFLLGHPIGPNADELYTRIDYRPSWKWNISFELVHDRHGENLYDENGELIRNVGGDVFVPSDLRRDSSYKTFLDGAVTRNTNYRLNFSYQAVRQFFFGGGVEYRVINDDHNNEQLRYLTLNAGLWLEL